MKKPWKDKEYQYFRKAVNKKPRLSFFDYLVIFFSEGFGWLVLGLVAICGLVYLFCR